MLQRRIRLLDRVSGSVVEDCSGPDPSGLCPRAQHGAPVPCAGSRLLAWQGTGIDGWSFEVGGDTRACPLTWLLAHD